MLIAHISDLHFGRIAHERVVGALIADVNAHEPDLVVVSGDLTQRARHREWRGAVELLDALPTPQIVIPGNHDVFAWWFPIRRLFTPLGRYRECIGDRARLTWSDGDVAVIAVNDAIGHTVKGGRFTDRDIANVRQFGSEHSDARHKVLVVHHQIASSRLTGRGDVARGSDQLLKAAVEVGFDCVLDGHVHVSTVRVLGAGRQSVLHCTAGTATSDRGRFADTGHNGYSLLRINDEVVVDERRFDASTNTLQPYRESTFQKDADGWRAIEASDH